MNHKHVYNFPALRLKKKMTDQRQIRQDKEGQDNTRDILDWLGTVRDRAGTARDRAGIVRDRAGIIRDRAGIIRDKWHNYENTRTPSKSVFEILGKFHSHGQNRAQRLRYVILWHIVIWYMGLFCLSVFLYKISTFWSSLKWVC